MPINTPILSRQDELTVQGILNGTHVYPHECVNIEQLAAGYEPFLGRDQAKNIKIVRALVASSYAPEVRLGLRMALCQRSRRCQSLFCVVCAYRHLSHFLGDIESLCGENQRSGIIWVTVIAGVTDGGTPPVEELIGCARHRWSAALETASSHDPAFREIRWRGRFEVDLLRGSAQLKKNKRKCLTELGWRDEPRTPWLIPHLHAAVSLGEIAPERLEYCLRREFKASYQVVFKRQHRNKTVETNLRNMAGYALKADLPESSAVHPSVSGTTPTAARRGRYDDAELRFYARMMDDLGGLRGTLDFSRLNDTSA